VNALDLLETDKKTCSDMFFAWMVRSYVAPTQLVPVFHAVFQEFLRLENTADTKQERDVDV
jgi:hypothetical protein